MAQETIIRVTHEFAEDPAAVQRAYDSWAMLLARCLDMSVAGETPAASTCAISAQKSKVPR